ncbi:LITAF [Branchiostoma lanceolatum]|uniref:LITAF protein n=1 Tax=Branchiostoma lanceolatum TaxID=7740 RepID=A0A8J9ZIQ4_BRALA|nr:LITAF [Branchiostoma lanceolatum]
MDSIMIIWSFELFFLSDILVQMEDTKAPLLQNEVTPPHSYHHGATATDNTPQPQLQHGAPYPQPGTPVYYGAITQAGNSTVILAVPPTFSPDPVNMQCTNCGQRVTTTTAVNTGLATWIACGAICALGGFLGCCFVPFCLDSMKDVRHTCPSCRAHLGTYHRMK